MMNLSQVFVIFMKITPHFYQGRCAFFSRLGRRSGYITCFRCAANDSYLIEFQ